MPSIFRCPTQAPVMAGTRQPVRESGSCPWASLRGHGRPSEPGLRTEFEDLDGAPDSLLGGFGLATVYRPGGKTRAITGCHRDPPASSGPGTTSAVPELPIHGGE
jgi:hypothetical protein